MTTATTALHGLRPGQAAALSAWRDALVAGSQSELVVVPVGYGKTVIGVGSFAVAAEFGPDTCLYLTPTDVLRSQVYGGVEKALRLLESNLAVRKTLADNAAPHRMVASGANFIVATYQQVVASPQVYEQLCQRRRVHLVCDEAHHLGERGRWAEAIGNLPVASRLLLSATPVRLDRDALLGARYEDNGEGDLSVAPMVNVTMRQAWKEGRILKQMNMQMKDYAVQLRDSEGNVQEFTASEMADLPDFDQRIVRQKLRWNDDYIAPLVREFATTLQAKMGMAPGQHQGLVFAATTEHANHLASVFAKFHPSLRCVVIHSGDIADAENEKRLKAFHNGAYDVLIQVRKASEGFDAPTVSVLLKLDAVFSREPVIQQLGRGLRYNHNLSPGQNLLNVFLGRDPRLGPIIEHLERETPFPAIVRRSDEEGQPLRVDEHAEDEDEEPEFEDELTGPEIVDVVEAGDAYLDHTGRFIEGQQLTLFGGAVTPKPAGPTSFESPGDSQPDVFDIAGELTDAIEYCKVWTNRAARERARKFGQAENHHAALHMAYGRASGKKGALATAADYRAKGDWMKRQYMSLL